MGKTCCFTGHRNIAKEDEKTLRTAIRQAVVQLLEEGVTEFRVGGALGFDMMAADELFGLREGNPQLKVHIYVPCMQQDRFYSVEEKSRYHRQIQAADKILCVSKEYTRQCMLQRNQAMVNGSDVCVSYLRRQSGGTAYTVRYAQQKGCRILAL